MNQRPILTWPGKQASPSPAPALLQLFEVFDPNCELRIANCESQLCNLLFYGDNRATLSHLLANGYAGKIKLIYIDPPYQSGVAWQRKVRLRAAKSSTMQTSADAVFGRQTQYHDRWEDGDYLQFMFERLPLLRDLLSEDGSLWLHCDHRKAPHLQLLLEEVFGAENYLNTIFWRSQVARGAKVNAFYFPYSTHSILVFAKNRQSPTVWNPPKKEIVLNESEAARQFMRDERGFFRTSDPGTYSFASLKALHSEGRLYVPFAGEIVLDEVTGRVYGSKGGNLAVKYYLQPQGNGKWRVERAVDNLWDDIPGLGVTPSEDLGYPTQKTEALLERVIRTSSNPGDLVLDGFMGSGTTLAVAQKLGRRWIGCDNNYGAIQTTRRRLQSMPSPFALYADSALPTLHSPLSTLHSPQVQSKITRNLQNPATIEVQITDYQSPRITAQVAEAATAERISLGDWRVLVDSVEIDPAYNGEIFRSVYVDVPLKKSQQVRGGYSFASAADETTVAVRITDVIGEEIVIIQKL